MLPDASLCSYPSGVCLAHFSVLNAHAGVHQSNDGAEVLSVDVDSTGKLLVMGDSKGNLRLYNHPCQSSGVSSARVV
jgi:hypothetical protein